MRQSITTSYRGHTETKPARIIARASGGASKAVEYSYDLKDAEANHIAAAQALCASLGWGGQWVGGGRGNDGFVFVDVSAAIDTTRDDGFAIADGEGFQMPRAR